MKTKSTEMINMRKQGMTLQAIADIYGCSRERVRQITFGQHARVALINKSCKEIIYPNLSSWMVENEVGIKDLYVLMGYKQNNEGSGGLGRVLKGRSALGLRMPCIRKVLEITGMTFEECFELKEGVLENVAENQ